MAVDTTASTRTVFQLIDQQVATPDAVAVRGRDATLSRYDLDARSTSVAGRLRELGVGPGDPVGLCRDRSAGLVAAALGIWKVGAAYVAIDPAYPPDRIRWMLDDAAAVAVVDDTGVAARERPVDPRPLPDDTAYVVYTSGSTGRPKGVPVTQAALLNLVAWHRAAFGLGPRDRCAQIASPGFDASVWEIWPALAAGASLHVVPDALRTDPVALRDWLVAERITVTFLPTAVAEGVLRLAWPEDVALRALLTGGDALTVRSRADAPFALINNYGLSETAVVATSGRVAPAGDGPPTIGRAIAGVTTEVLDDALQPVAPGAEGELVIGGVAVSPGYLNRPELTAQRFLDDAGEGWRYRTGDRVRLRPDGEIEYLGRLDDQLSIRGFRVEPGEVAAALNAHPAIAASVAVGIGRSSAERRLVAYVVARDGARPADDELAAHAGGFLPAHMVPARYVWLDALPVTAHGKVDRAALAGLDGPATAADTPVADDGDAVATVAAIVAELLEVEEVGRDENFFLLGGHSMLGAQLIVRLEARFGVEVSLRHLFDHPTVTQIAAEVQRQVAAGPVQGVSPPSAPAGAERPASLYHLLDPEVLADPYPLYRRLREEAPVHWDPYLHAWVVTRYADVSRVFLEYRAARTPAPDRLAALGMGELTPIAALMVRQMLFLDQPDHGRVRRLAAAAFTPRRIAHLREHIRQIATGLVDRLDGVERFDVMDAIANTLPAIVTAEMLGVPTADHGLLKSWSQDFAEMLGNFQHNPGRAKRTLRSVEAMVAYFRAAVLREATRPTDGLINALVTAEVDGDRFTDEEIVANVIVTMVGGQETTTNLIGNGLLTLLRRPEALERLRAEPALMPAAVEELLRYESPSQHTARLAPAEATLGDQEIPEGAAVIAVMGAANRDPERFPEPDRLDLGRPDNRHLAFGWASHFCFGAPLARMEGAIAFETLLDRFPGLALAPDQDIRWRPNLGLRGLTELHVLVR